MWATFLMILCELFSNLEKTLVIRENKAFCVQNFSVMIVRSQVSMNSASGSSGVSHVPKSEIST